VRHKRSFGSYIDKKRAGSLKQLLSETAGAWEEEESAISDALCQFNAAERELLWDVARGKHVNETQLGHFIDTRERLRDALGEKELAGYLITLSPRMYLQSFVLYYVKLRQLRSLPDYRAICTRLTRRLGRNARVADLTDDLVAGWVPTLTNPGSRKIANAIIRACRQLVFRETSRSAHPVFWTQKQRETYMAHVAQLPGAIGHIPRAAFWKCFASLAGDLGCNLVDLRTMSKTFAKQQGPRLSKETVAALHDMPVETDEPLFAALTPDRITRRHRELCWSSGVLAVRLSRTELTIVRAVAEGATTHEMRAALGLNENQLSHFRKRIAKVRGAIHDRQQQQLIARAMSRGLTKNRVPDASEIALLCQHYGRDVERLSHARIKAGRAFKISLRRIYQILGPVTLNHVETWDELRDLYCRGPMQRMSPFMSRKIQVALNRFEAVAAPGLLSEIDDAKIQRFHEAVRDTSYDADELCVLRRVLEFASDCGFMPSLPNFTRVGLAARPPVKCHSATSSNHAANQEKKRQLRLAFSE
jgi:DNA-binding CsgD family transcriptional regulator